MFKFSIDLFNFDLDDFLVLLDDAVVVDVECGGLESNNLLWLGLFS